MMLKEARKHERNHVGLLLCFLIICIYYDSCAGKNIEGNDISHSLRVHHEEHHENKETDKSCERKKSFDVVHYHDQRKLSGIGMCAHLCWRSCNKMGVTNDTKLDACATTWMNRHCLLLGWLFPEWKRNTLGHCESDLSSTCHNHDCQEEDSCAMPGSCCSNERLCSGGICVLQGSCCLLERQCTDGSCVTSDQCCPDERLCLDNRKCIDEGSCCSNEKSCADGKCVASEACCSDQKLCSDSSCVLSNTCCPDETLCDDGSCVANNACCPNKRRCSDNTCILLGTCCSSERKCTADGSCIPSDSCCTNEKKCSDGKCVLPGTCCASEKKCSDGTCIGSDSCCPNDRKCDDGKCVSSGSCCVSEKKCSTGSCIPESTCCSNERKCANGSCALPGTCCTLERLCPDSTCIATGGTTCCPSETRCSDGTCIPKSDTLNCSQANTTLSFLRFVKLDTLHNASEAMTTIDPKLVNDVIDVLRSKLTNDALKYRITPESIIKMMFPNPDFIFHLSEITSKVFRNRELLAHESRDLMFGDTTCDTAFINFFVNCTDFVLHGIGVDFMSSGSLSEFVKDLFQKVLGDNASPMIGGILRKSDKAWMEGSKLQAAQYAWSVFSYVVHYFGLNSVLGQLQSSLTETESEDMAIGVTLSIMNLIATDGAALNDPSVLASTELVTTMTSFTSWYYACTQPATCGTPPKCDDNNRCTVDTMYCENGLWTCENSPVLCLPWMSCDYSSGLCMPDDSLVPCVAVIDEDSSFGIPDEVTLWSQFRSQYPSRPFCLLIAGPKTDVVIPPSYLNDSNTIVVENIRRDNGNGSQITNWVGECGLGQYSSLISAPKVGLYIDNTGSLLEAEVSASHNLFNTGLSGKGIAVQQVYNADENWIIPFMKTFVEPKGCVGDGKAGECLLTSQCSQEHKKTVLYKMGDPEPSCKDLAYDYQCCVPYSCAIKGEAGDCLDVSECYSIASKYAVPWKNGDSEPNCGAFPSHVQCCIPCKGHVCDDGTCALTGTCCSNERMCSDGNCVKEGTCCSSETKCSNTLCVVNAENIACTQANTTLLFLKFFDTVPNTSEAIKTISPALTNSFIDVLRSRVSSANLKAMITPLDVVKLMLPDPSVTFHFNDLGDTNPTRRDLVQDSSLELLFGKTLCDEKFIEYFIHSLSFVFSAIGITGVSPTPLSPFVKEILDGDENIIMNVLRLSKKSWMAEPGLDAVSYVSSVFVYVVKFVGLNAFINSLEERLTMTLGMKLSLISLVATDGAPLNTPTILGSASLNKTIQTFSSWYDTCFPSGTCVGSPICDDRDLCTVDISYCESGSWKCQHNPVVCLSGFSCDRGDGQCKADDFLAPCVAVIDEDGSFGTPSQEAMWSQFRSQYPSRPFCLLVPGLMADIGIPSNFINDPYTIRNTVVRDNGNSSLAMNWAQLCGIDKYTPTNVQVVGLFVDNSGSLLKSHVQASINKFSSSLNDKGMKFQEVYNDNENWIKPFMTSLAPRKDCFASGKSGQCLLLDQCTANSRRTIPYFMGDAEPNCKDLAYQFECCIPYSCTAEGSSGDCLDVVECANMGKKAVPSTPSDPNPSCKALPSNVQCCIPCKGHMCTGGVCAMTGSCCSYERMCSDGKCVGSDICCSNETKCTHEGSYKGKCVDNPEKCFWP